MTTSIDLFAYATRYKLRFVSVRGVLSAEQLWDVPLRSRDDFNLDEVAKGVNKELKAATEESFVETDKSPSHTRLEAALAVVIHIIDAKKADEAAAEKRAKNKAEREQLLGILAEKQAGELSELSVKELKKRIAALEE